MKYILIVSATLLVYAFALARTYNTTVSTTSRITSYNGVQTVSNGIPVEVAMVDANNQSANIGTSTLYAVPTNGFYRVSIYISVLTAGTTSTMPSTTITYTDGNAGTNTHSTTTTATSTGNSVTTTFAQVSYILYAKAGTNITYAASGYASTGSAMTFALRMRVEVL